MKVSLPASSRILVFPKTTPPSTASRGPQNGFEIADATPTWDAFIGGQRPLNAVKTYVYLRVRLLFDPPGTSYLVDALNNQIKEHEWRLNQLREETMWTDPTGTLVLNEGAILGGGSP